MQETMKITCLREPLLAALATAKSVVTPRTSTPVLANACIVANGQITVAGTDMDAWATATVAGEIGARGTATASCHSLHDAIKAFPKASEIELVASEAEGNAILEARSGALSFSLPTIPAEYWPKGKIGKPKAAFTLPATELARVLATVRHAISTGGTICYLNGIYLHSTATGEVVAVAADGHRLASTKIAVAEEVSADGTNFGEIIPHLTVKALANALKGLDGNIGVTISSDPPRIEFHLGDLVLLSKVVDGTYIDYMRVIPDGNPAATMTVDRAALYGAINQIYIFMGSGPRRGIRLDLTKDQATLSTSVPDAGTAKVSLAVDCKGAPFDIGFNGGYMAETLNALTSELVTLKFTSAGVPIRIVDHMDDRTIHLLMPLPV